MPLGRVSVAALPPSAPAAPAVRPLSRPRHLRGSHVVPEEPDPQGVQVLRVVDDAAARARHHLRRRPQRLGQVQRRRRPRLGDGRAGRQEPARRQDGGRHLRRHVRPPAAGPGRGAAHHRQHRRRAADRLRRGDDQPDHVPQRRLGVRHQRHPVPAARRAGAAQRLRHRPRDARDRRPGPARHDPARDPGGPPRLHRGGGRRPQAPQAQGEGAPQARLDRGQPDPARRPAQRDPPPAQAARPPGRGGPAGRGRPGRRPRRPRPAARRRPRHRPHRARAGARRRDRSWSSAASEVEAALAQARETEGRLEAVPARRPARPRPRPRRPGSGCPAARAAARHGVARRRAGPQRRRLASRRRSTRPRPRRARGRGRPGSGSRRRRSPARSRPTAPRSRRR